MDTELNYNYKIVKQFAIATVVWGVVGMLVGVFIAAQLAWPAGHERSVRLREARAARGLS